MVLKTGSKREEDNNLIIYHQNIRGLNKKQDEINIMLQAYQSRPHTYIHTYIHIYSVS